jgi:hypothetical protein
MADWRFLARVALKAALLFALCNLLFALARPLDALGALSLYNRVLPGRVRLPYGEEPRSRTTSVSTTCPPCSIATSSRGRRRRTSIACC